MAEQPRPHDDSLYGIAIRLREMSDELDRITLAYDAAETDAANKQTAWEVAKADALLDPALEGDTLPVKQAKVTLRTQKELGEHRVAESVLHRVKAQIAKQEKRISAEQTRARIMETDYNTTRYRAG